MAASGSAARARVKMEAKMKRSLGYRLQHLRKARELSMRSLSSHLNDRGAKASYSAIQKWESDEAIPSKKNMEVLCEYFAVEAGWLHSGNWSSDDNLSELMDSIKVLSADNQRLIVKIVEAMAENEELQRTYAGKPREPSS